MANKTHINRPKDGHVNDGPMKAPADLGLAREHRIADLRAVLDSEPAGSSRHFAAAQELEHIETFGYTWPKCAGYPVSGPVYDDHEQQRLRLEAAGE